MSLPFRSGGNYICGSCTRGSCRCSRRGSCRCIRRVSCRCCRESHKSENCQRKKSQHFSLATELNFKNLFDLYPALDIFPGPWSVRLAVRSTVALTIPRSRLSQLGFLPAFVTRRVLPFRAHPGGGSVKTENLKLVRNGRLGDELFLRVPGAATIYLWLLKWLVIALLTNVV